MAEPSAAPPAVPSGKGVFESFVDLIHVATDWSLIVLVVLIVFRKEIGDHVSDLVEEVINLTARVQRITVGGTTWVFSDLQHFQFPRPEPNGQPTERSQLAANMEARAKLLPEHRGAPGGRPRHLSSPGVLPAF